MLRAAVVGCGYGGGLSIEALQRSALYEPPSACDVSPAARMRASDRFPTLRLYDDIRAMLTESSADVVCVATPAPTHEPIARVVIEHGANGLLLEKPLACGFDAAKRLLDEIRERALPIVVPHGMLVLAAPQEVKRRLLDGEIGELRTIQVQNAVDLLNAGIHWLAYLLDVFTDDSPGSIVAHFDVDDHAINDGVQVESCGVTTIEMRSGIRVEMKSGIRTVPTSIALPTAHQRGALFRFVGSRGVMELSAWAGSYWIQRGVDDGMLVERPMPSGLTYHQVFLEQLADNITAGTTDYSSAELSLDALRVIGDAYRQYEESAWTLGVPASEESDDEQ